MYTSKLLVEGQSFENTHTSAFEAMEMSCTAYAAWKGISVDEAGGILAALETAGKLEDKLFLNGVEVDVFDHLGAGSPVPLTHDPVKLAAVLTQLNADCERTGETVAPLTDVEYTASQLSNIFEAEGLEDEHWESMAKLIADQHTAQ